LASALLDEANQVFAVELNGRGEICVRIANKKASSIMPEVADLTMLALLIGGFALAFAYARICGRVLAAGKDIPL
jgi:hypothetical protein